MLVSASLVRRVLVMLVVVAVAVCALASQRPLVTSAAADTPMQMTSTAAVLAQPTVMATGARMDTSEIHGATDCDGTASGGTAHACVHAVTLVLSALTALARTGVEAKRTGRRPMHGHLVSAQSNSPPWTVLSLVQLSVSRV